MRRTNRTGLPFFAAVATILTLICASALPAQNKKKDEDSSSRTLQGTVLDGAGTPVDHAVVQLKDTRTLQVLSFITKEDGTYHFGGLKLDTEYQVRAEGGGASTDWKRISVFDPRKTVIVNFKLEKK